MLIPNYGLPKFGTPKSVRNRIVSADGYMRYMPVGGIIDGTKTRNPFNSGIAADSTAYRDLESGLLMGRVTSGGKWANSVIGVSQGALAGSGTTLSLTAIYAVELLRRQGATGTFSLTGPKAAAGTVRTSTVTYSAINTTTGDVTITALGVNQAEDVRFTVAATGGNLQLNVQKPDGTRATTGNIARNVAWSATDATFLASINTALDTATGVVGGIVATAIAATDTDLGFTLTYSGTGYAGETFAPAVVALQPTSIVSWFVVPRTTAVSGAFVTGSYVGPTDGSQVPQSFLPDDYGEFIPDDSSDVPFARIPWKGAVLGAQLLPYAADTSLRQWVRDKLEIAGSFEWNELLA
jgi:hypothetical protein